MATSIQVKRGTTAKVAAYTPLSGELVLDTTTNKLYAGDGTRFALIKSTDRYYCLSIQLY